MKGHRIYYNTERKCFIGELDLTEMNIASLPMDSPDFWVQPCSIEELECKVHEVNEKKDEIFICEQCGRAYRIENFERDWYLIRDLQVPKRCYDCRANNRWKGGK